MRLKWIRTDPSFSEVLPFVFRATNLAQPPNWTHAPPGVAMNSHRALMVCPPLEVAELRCSPVRSAQFLGSVLDPAQLERNHR